MLIVLVKSMGWHYFRYNFFFFQHTYKPHSCIITKRSSSRNVPYSHTFSCSLNHMAAFPSHCQARLWILSLPICPGVLGAPRRSGKRKWSKIAEGGSGLGEGSQTAITPNRIRNGLLGDPGHETTACCQCGAVATV